MTFSISHTHKQALKFIQRSHLFLRSISNLVPREKKLFFDLRSQSGAMTRIFALLPLIASALAGMGSDLKDMASSSDSMDFSGDESHEYEYSSSSMDVSGGKSHEYQESSFSVDVSGDKSHEYDDSSFSNSEEGIEIKVGDVHIKIVGLFDGLTKWQWDGDKPGEDATIHQVWLLDWKFCKVGTER